METTTGKIRGTVINKVNAFKGVPYGAPTGGPMRFMPPSKSKAWAGVLETVDWPKEAPQGPHTEIPEVAATIPKTGISEDCLHLNVWTPALRDGRKRPVLVWFHPGAFSSGTSNEPAADGARLSRRGDVVVVTVNPRINAFGYLYLAEFGTAG